MQIIHLFLGSRFAIVVAGAVTYIIAIYKNCPDQIIFHEGIKSTTSIYNNNYLSSFIKYECVQCQHILYVQ